jgi:signal transduction histidine kinase/streptogramin lyase
MQDLGSYFWTNQPVYGLYEDTRNCVWVATLGSGLFRYNPDGTVLHLTTRDGLPTDSLRWVTEDREGNMWVGMEGGGLCRLKPTTFQSLGVHDGLSSDQVMSMCESTNDSYWIGMNGNGLDHLTHDRVEHFGPAEGLLNGHVWSVVQDRQGTIWAGTWGGLFKWQDGRFINVADAQIGGVILAMYEDHDNGLWLGQQAFGMLTRLKGDEKTTTKIPGTSTSLDVRVITEDSRNNLWIGTENEGLYRGKDGHYTRFGKKDGLANESIWSLLAESDGTVWIGTCGGGLSCYREGRIRTWTTDDGLVNDVICQILEDARGNLWLGSYGGVFSISKSELAGDNRRPGRKIHCVSYSKADGLPSIECQGGFEPSGYKSPDGRLWFPTIKGFAIVNPAQVEKNPVSPIVLMEDLMVDDLIQPGPAKANASGTRTTVPLITIPPGKSHFEFHYTATSLTAPEKVRFKYRLEGLENNWTDAGTHRSASYSRLPPGNYNFHVIACNNDGLWNEQGATLAITILPFFWQTGWFMTLAGLIVFMIIFAAVRLVVTRRLHLRLERLEREQTVQRERTRIAKDIHDDLGASLTEIAILSELAQNPETPANEAAADLRRIVTKTKTLTQMLDEIVWAVNPQRDTVENFVTYTCSYAEDFLRVAQIQCRLQLPPEVPEISLRTDLRHGLFLVVKETLNNIVKHAGASEVKIKMEMRTSKLIIGIQDNGKGFTQPGSGLEAISGDGLSNMSQRVEGLGGRFNIFSQPGRGTHVQIIVPINN